MTAALGCSSSVGTSSGNVAAPAFASTDGNGASYAATTSSGSEDVVAPFTTIPTGRSGFLRAKSCQAMKPFDTRPVNSPVFRITSAATESAWSTAQRSPIGPPQSCTTTTASDKSSPDSKDDTYE